MLDEQNFEIHYQPIFNLGRDALISFEALARFRDLPHLPPDEWFSYAAKVGLQELLEYASVRKAIAGLDQLPEHAYLSINLSPSTILGGQLREELAGFPLHRLMIEVTEHADVTEYERIAQVLELLRKEGLRLAVDDAGAGFASFRHILKLQPDVIKLDRSLIHDIDSSMNCRALAAALIRFAEETGAQVVAEGVETDEELRVLRELKVANAQGFLLGRPLPLSEIAPVY